MPRNKHERLEAVNRFLNLQLTKETELQDIVELAASIFSSAAAMITLIDDQLYHVKFSTGADLSTVDPQGDSEICCLYTLTHQETLVVEDLARDPRMITEREIMTDKSFRFFAGVPLITTDGNIIGTLCVIDMHAKQPESLQIKMLESLARQIIKLFEFESTAQVLRVQYEVSIALENKLRSFFESSSSCHLLMDNDMNVMAYNKHTSAIIQLNHQVKLKQGMKIIDYVHPSFVKAFTKSFKRALQGHIVNLTRKLDYPHGTIYWDITYEPAFDPQGKITGVSFNASDISNRVQNELHLAEQIQTFRKIAYIQEYQLWAPASDIIHLMDIIKSSNHYPQTVELKLLEDAVADLKKKCSNIISSNKSDQHAIK